MGNLCSNTRGCPASLYMNCQGYKDGLNCWEVNDKPCCLDTDRSRCRSCEVYKVYTRSKEA